MANIRNYKSNDEKKIVELFNDIFQQNRSIEQWKWQFRDNPAGNAIIALAEDADELIGQCTLIPSRIVIGQRELLGGQSVDAMTHKDYRRKGYFEKLSLLSYCIGKEQGIAFRYSFPSPPTLDGLLSKMGGTLICKTPVYIQIHKVASFVNLFCNNMKVSNIVGALIEKALIMIKPNNLKRTNMYTISQVRYFDEEFDNLWDRHKVKCENLTVRSGEFLNWRIANHPCVTYKTFKAVKGALLGYIILKIETKKVRGKYLLKVGTIIDMITSEDGVAEELLAVATEHFTFEGVDFVSAWVTDNSFYKNTFKKAAYFRTNSSIPFVLKKINNGIFLPADIYKKEKWYLMPIESDSY